MHPAYVDLFCDRHELWHQSEICPRCEVEDAPEYCKEHDIDLFDGEECEMCAERYNDMLSQRELSQDGAR